MQRTREADDSDSSTAGITQRNQPGAGLAVSGAVINLELVRINGMRVIDVADGNAIVSVVRSDARLIAGTAIGVIDSAGDAAAISHAELYQLTFGEAVSGKNDGVGSCVDTGRIRGRGGPGADGFDIGPEVAIDVEAA